MAKYVPPVFPPIPNTPPANPLALLDDLLLQRSQALIELACGRSHTPLKSRNRQYVCFLNQLLKLEIRRRANG
jgi:hypothetical protein